MTALPMFGRALTVRSLARAASHLSTCSLQRVSLAQNTVISRELPFWQVASAYKAFKSQRYYATETAKKSAPKGKRAKTTKKTAKKTTKKPKAKTTKTKSKAKPKKKVLTEAQKERQTRLKAKKAIQDAKSKLKERKEVSLVGKEPKAKPSTAWTVLVTETTQSSPGQVTTSIKQAAEKYRNLSPSEREHYNHLANQNKAANEAAYKKWVSSYTPGEIHAANNARKALRRDAKKKSTYHLITDDRLVRQPLTAYTFFYKERHASGDFKGMPVTESAKLIGREWRSVGANDKQRYDGQAKREKARYSEEYKTVYGADLPSASRKRT